ncbi:hypothetical protein [Cellulomonas denverensis]|uniref:Uncharacterized protein n=1 Tax=Cellulomonas denverensis TaxID=264297 RepID=A0A7X6KY25_9CELL|nr:hypothetical protein [Cellulomonas denverensis]NKY24268.1 hypothetical protein [Cellulomonas denverensis]
MSTLLTIFYRALRRGEGGSGKQTAIAVIDRAWGPSPDPDVRESMAVALSQFLTFAGAALGTAVGLPCIALAAAVDHALGVRLLALALSVSALPLLGLSLVWALRAVRGTRSIRAWRRAETGPFVPDPASQPRDIDLALAAIPWAALSALIWAIVL